LPTTVFGMYNKYMAAINGSLLSDAIMATDIELIDVNQGNLMEGMNALGLKIEPKYKNPKYALKKEQKNSFPGYGTPDLYVTGSFHEKIELFISGGVLQWENSDGKAADLLAKYGSVLGVFENDRLIKYRSLYLFPATARLIKQQTGMQ
jgi:hypothetical protein